MQAAAQVGGGTMATKSCTVVDKGHTLVFSAMRPRVTLQPAAAVE